ncbi:MAG: thioredoxin domain-containing protein, partial [Nitrospirae bacterium]
ALALVGAARPANHLAGERSPYLQMHAHNPVDWYPWGEAALARARREDKPIFLSIGYATCHWCHVMERESFEDPEIARLLNRYFVCIKVDREERPDLDAIYMAAVQAMTGNGGWPLTVFLTPDLKPIFGGTYFPPHDRAGQIGLAELAEQIHRLWVEERKQVEERGARLAKRLAAQARLEPGDGVPGAAAFDTYLARIAQDFDPVYGGFGQGTKFPGADDLDLLLWLHARSRKPDLMPQVARTLDAMLAGGLYDHLGGGFHRYCVDRAWRVPHFEKMLYTNALLVRLYLDAYRVTGRDAYARVARESCDYLLRDLRLPGGAFAGAEDADSEGEEGRFYVWRLAEVRRLLGREEAALFAAAYDLTEAGNWHDGLNILHRVANDAALAKRFHLEPAAVAKRLAVDRARLRAARSKRVRPLRDDKVLAAWNGLAITALARASEVLGEPRYAEAAAGAARFCLEKLWRKGRLLRRWRDGEAKVAGQLDDHAFLAAGLLDLYEATLERRWLRRAQELVDAMVARFADPAGGFFDTDGSDPTLLYRPKELFEGAIPTGNAVAVMDLLRLAGYTGEQAYEARARKALAAFGRPLSQAPRAVPRLLQALDVALNGPVEVVVAGPPEQAASLRLWSVVRRTLIPGRLVGRAGDPGSAKSPWAAGRTPLGGRPT